MPINLGRIYYIHGYEQHKNILLGLIDHISPGVKDLVRTDAPERVEIVVQEFVTNIADNLDKDEADGLVVHLINLTGFSNTYFDPLPVYDVKLDVACAMEPARIFSMA